MSEAASAIPASQTVEVSSAQVPTPSSSVPNLYRQALKYFKDNEGRNVVLDYDVKLKLVALTQQVLHGPLDGTDLEPLGAFDMIGKDRRKAWSQLGQMSKEDAMQEFTDSVKETMPEFNKHLEEVEAQNQRQRLREEQQRVRAAEAEANRAAEAEAERLAEVERQRDEEQRRKIQDALNRQTFSQFKAYAEQQYTGDPDRQAVLVKQLQEQHYRQYMQQVYQQHMESQAGQCIDNITSTTVSTETETPSTTEMATLTSTSVSPADNDSLSTDVGKVTEQFEQLSTTAVSTTAASGEGGEDVNGQDIEEIEDVEEDEYYCDEDDVPPATMWTKKEIQDFKLAIKSEGGDSVLSIGHGETVTVRVPTHAEGSALFWEFATDNYDVAFGLFFEWVDHDETEISVHISDSEDEDLDDDEDEDEYNETNASGSGNSADPENGGSSAALLAAQARAAADKGPPTSVVVPIYRRDCHQEVYAGTHQYPGKGIYLLKFDNSYSLWRSKTLYYRVYYTK